MRLYRRRPTSPRGDAKHGLKSARQGGRGLPSYTPLLRHRHQGKFLLQPVLLLALHPCSMTSALAAPPRRCEAPSQNKVS